MEFQYGKVCSSLPLLTLCVARLTESLGKRVVVDLELCDLLVLVGRDPDERRLLEDVRPEGGVGQLRYITGADEVEAGLVLVHRVQDGLQEKGDNANIVFGRRREREKERERER
jgi:hypothetical protein